MFQAIFNPGHIYGQQELAQKGLASFHAIEPGAGDM